MNRRSECLPKAGQCVNVADLVTPGLPLLSCLPREAINKEIMAKQFTLKLWVSLMLLKCANHFFHYSTGGVGVQERESQREGERDTQRVCDRVKLTETEIQTMMEKDRVHVQIMYSEVPWCIYGDDVQKLMNQHFTECDQLSSQAAFVSNVQNIAILGYLACAIFRNTTAG